MDILSDWNKLELCWVHRSVSRGLKLKLCLQNLFDLTNGFLQGLKRDLLSQLRLQKEKSTEGSNKTLLKPWCRPAVNEFQRSWQMKHALLVRILRVILLYCWFKALYAAQCSPLYHTQASTMLQTESVGRVCLFLCVEKGSTSSLSGKIRPTLSGRLLDIMSTWIEIVSTKLFLLVRRSSSAGRQRQCN